MADPKPEHQVIDDLPETIPVTEDELRLIETHLGRIIAEMLADT